MVALGAAVVLALPSAMLLLTGTASAQTTPSRGWVDVNFLSLQSSQGEETFEFDTPVSFEVASAVAAYPELPRTNRGDVAAGFTFLPRVGVGVHFDLAKYEIGAGLGVRIPHPLFFNRFATDETVTSPPLERKDIAVDIPVVFIPQTPNQWRVRLFAGPTYFKMTQEMVGIIEYDQLFNLLGFNSVEITSFVQQKVEGSAWGFNAGVDVAYFFSPHVGGGGVIRVNRGTVTIDEEPLSGQKAEFSVGHVSAGGGVRFRF